MYLFLATEHANTPKERKREKKRKKISTWNYTYQLVIANYNLHTKMNTWVKQKNQIGNRTELQLQRIFFFTRAHCCRISYWLSASFYSTLIYQLHSRAGIFCPVYMCIMRNGQKYKSSRNEEIEKKERRESENTKNDAQRSITTTSMQLACHTNTYCAVCSSISLHRW